jgi:uncharacterized protein YbaP (TraB family)
VSGARWIAVALLALVAIACQTTTRPKGAPKSRVKVDTSAPQAFFWEAKAPNGARLYLLGSVHIGDGRELALDPRIERDWEQAQELVVELDTSALSEIDAIGATHRHGLLPEPTTLRQVVRAETYAQLKQYIQQRGYDMERVEQMRPWLVAQVVTGLEYDAAGLQAQNGVDAVLLRRARGRKSIVPLETLEEQMALFAGMPDALQETWLLEILREAPAFVQVTRAILDAWERGDEQLLNQLLFGAAQADPALAQFYAQVFDVRNQSMADRLAALAADEKPRFVVVGTGHMLGPRGIPELLAARGFEVERVGKARVVGGAIAAPALPLSTTPSAAEPATLPPPSTSPPAEPAAAPTILPTSGPAPAAAEAAPTSPIAPATAPVTEPSPPPAPAAAPPPAPVAETPAPTAPEPAPAPAPAAEAPATPAQQPTSPRPGLGAHDEWFKQDAPAAR